jgi:hypothetical protein
MLLLPPEYSLEIQARIPTTLCVLHNFILTHDNIDVLMDEDCYARRTRTVERANSSQGRCSRRDATSLNYEVLGFLRSQGPEGF